MQLMDAGADFFLYTTQDNKLDIESKFVQIKRDFLNNQLPLREVGC